VLTDLAESDPIAQAEITAFRAALATLGWTEGTNLHIELRWAAADPERYKKFASELVSLNPEAILSRGTPVTKALASETRTIPIVFVVVADPIGSGLATNLALPGGNITGFSNLFTEMGGKWIELLKEIAPRTERVWLLFNPATLAPLQLFMPSIQAAASSLAIQVSAAPVQAKGEIESVIAAQARVPGSALIVMPDGFILANRELIIALTASYGVPAIYFNSVFFAQRGGLISYGPDFVDYFRRAAGYIVRILKGEKAGNLPIQQPTKFELAINLKTAKALGLDVSLQLQQRADEVIE
jgi:putative ABC transport system substrate-binding protein